MTTTFLVVKNRVHSKLAAALTAGATSLSVTAGDGADFPSTYPFHLTIDDEIVSVTNRSTDNMTIVRAQQSTSDVDHANKTHVALNITAKSITDLNTAVNTIEATVVSAEIILGDDKFVKFGAGTDGQIGYETADANALALIFALPHADEDASNVPVAVFGDLNIVNVNLGFFDGITQPRVAVVDADRDSWVSIGFNSTEDDKAEINKGGTAWLNIQAGGSIPAAATISSGLNGISGVFDFYPTLTAGQEYRSGYFRANYRSTTPGNPVVTDFTGVEGVAASYTTEEAITFRGGHFRTYINADATSTMRSAMGLEASARASHSTGTECVAEAGTMFTGIRIWMAPYFTSGSLTNLNNFWGLWIYGEHATQRNADSAIKISDAGGGFTYDITFQEGTTLVDDGTDLTIVGANFALGDDTFIKFGGVAYLGWETADIDVNLLVLALPNGGAVDSPTLMIGDQSVLNFDLGTIIDLAILDEPNIIVVDADADSYLSFGYHSDDTPHIHTNRTLRLEVSGDTDDYFKFATDTGVPTIFATGSYLRIGDVQFTQHSLDAEDDLMVSGELEVTGSAFFDGAITQGFAMTATSGGEEAFKLTITDAATQTAGMNRAFVVDLTVSGAKSGTAHSEVASLDLTLSGNTNTAYGMGIWITDSGGADHSLTEGLNIYLENMGAGTLGAIVGLDIGINSTNVATGRHVALRMRNHSGTAKTAILFEGAFITGIDLGGIGGGGIAGLYTRGIDFSGGTYSVAEIDLDFGKIIFDQDGDTDIHCDVDDELDFKLSGSNFVIMAAGVVRPGTTNQVDLGSSAKQFKDIYIDGIAYIDTLGTSGHGTIIDTAVAKGTWTASGTWTLPAFTLGGLITATGQGIANASYISFGASPGQSGSLRMENDAYVIYRNAAGSADVGAFRVNSSNLVQFGAALAAISLGGTVTIAGQTFDAGSGDLKITTTGSERGLAIDGSNSGFGPEISLNHTHTTPDLNAVIGAFDFWGYDSAGTPLVFRFTTMRCMATNVTDGAEEASIYYYMATGGGADNLAYKFSGAGLLWADVGFNADEYYQVAGTQVVAAQGAAVADATDAASAITQLNALLARLRTHGLIAT